MSLIETLLEKPANLAIASKYTAMNGIVYLSAGAVLILWPAAVQAIFRDRAFIGHEQGLIRAMGMAVVVIGWLYLFAGCSGSRQSVAASVIDRLTIVPLVLLPLAASGVLVGTGIMGGLSTFSSFAYGVVVLMPASTASAIVASVYVVTSLVLGYVAVVVGLKIGGLSSP